MRKLIALVLALPASARATPEPANRTTLHVCLGSEGLSHRASGFRAHALIGRAFGSRVHRPALAFGATGGIGSLEVNDPTARDGNRQLALSSVGLQAQLGVRFVDGGVLDNRIYLGFAVTRFELEQRHASAEYGTGMRVAVGANWLDSVVQRLDEPSYGDEVGHLFMMIFPHQAELVWDRSAGSDRFGVAFGWGL